MKMGTKGGGGGNTTIELGDFQMKIFWERAQRGGGNEGKKRKGMEKWKMKKTAGKRSQEKKGFEDRE